MKTFIFDYDDTLAPNQHYYCYAQLNFIKYILDKFGYKSPDVQSVINLEVNIDIELLKTLGWSQTRFPSSLREAFRQICESRNYPCTEQELQEIYDIGKQAFDIKPGLVKGAEETLDFLLAKGDELVLCTKGDTEIQQKKIDLNNLRRWFAQENMHIVAGKNSTDLERIIGKKDKDKTFKIGNSIRSDVNPALEAGIKVIYIPCETWAYEREHNGIDKNNPRLFVFQDIKEIIKNYERL